MESEFSNFAQTLTGPPRDLLPHVISFCSSISSDTPVYLPIVSDADDLAKECIGNVDRRTVAEGGKAILGWRIHEWYGLMIEAEFHVIWEDKAGMLRDVTPTGIHCERALFLPDTNIEYAERQINNVRYPLTPDPKIKEFIKVSDSIFGFYNRGKRANMYGEIRLTEREEGELNQLKSQKSKLFQEIMRSLPNRNDPCRCGFGKKYKKCHGK